MDLAAVKKKLPGRHCILQIMKSALRKIKETDVEAIIGGTVNFLQTVFVKCGL